jgi:hypothetical protein
MRRKTLQNFNERSNKAIDLQPVNIGRQNAMQESPGSLNDVQVVGQDISSSK